ncbi:MAG: glycerol-3-phosphate dehydrogenase [Moritella sp.]|jgi:glycerol-3-phosphate dehydrogenase
MMSDTLTSTAYRKQKIKQLQQNGTAQHWDIIIVGGGITGAGALLLACQAGLKALLIEQKDFAWGASSNSSKMVHGGLRYLGTGQYSMTKDAVTEREQLLNELPGLVNPLQFIMGHYKYKFPGPILFNTLLAIYDLIAGKNNHNYIGHNINDFHAPGLNLTKLQGATRFADAATDDARLVIRVLQEAQDLGGTALNYLAAIDVNQTADKVTGLNVCDAVSGAAFSISASVVINATGPWADRLRQPFNVSKAIRPLRGSHLIVPTWRLPLAYSVSYFHPKDKRPIFAFPWENVTVIGTTDLDHKADLDIQPSISQEEVDYLLTGINQQFPQADITEDDVISSYAGIRPVVSSNPNKQTTKPSDEKREHSIWDDKGLISVSGGKLTTFRLIAKDALIAAQPYLPKMDLSKITSNLFQPITQKIESKQLYPQQIERLKSSYGKHYCQLINGASANELQPIAFTNTLLAELKWALAHEMVVHLDDLLLRRSRMGLLLPAGGKCLFAELKPLCQQTLSWDEEKWQQEVDRYLGIIQAHFSLPSQQHHKQDKLEDNQAHSAVVGEC